MKHLLTIIIMFVATGLNAASLQFHVSVTNSWNQSRFHNQVAIPLKDVPGLKFDVKSATVFVGRHSGKINKVEVMQTTAQLDDLNGDQRADELVFLTSEIKAGTTSHYTIELYDDAQSGNDSFGFDSHPERSWVYVDMMLEDKKDKHPLITALEAPGESYLYNDLYHHGAAFENELCAFRVYFDQRQNIDLYGKRKRQLELAQTNFYTTPEQMKQGFGNDVLWAGSSVGCGSFKGWDGTAPTNIEPVAIRGQRIISAGPLRTIVEVKALGWKGLNMRQYYILYASHRECEVRVEFDRPLTTETFATGVQKIGQTPAGFVRNDGIAASWGSDYPEMGKKEQFPPEAVGLAVYVPRQFIKATHESDLNYLFELQSKGATSLHYYVAFCADKEEPVNLNPSQRFASLDAPAGYHQAQAWFDAMSEWKAYLDHPVTVKIEK